MVHQLVKSARGNCPASQSGLQGSVLALRKGLARRLRAPSSTSAPRHLLDAGRGLQAPGLMSQSSAKGDSPESVTASPNARKAEVRRAGHGVGKPAME